MAALISGRLVKKYYLFTYVSHKPQRSVRSERRRRRRVSPSVVARPSRPGHRATLRFVHRIPLLVVLAGLAGSCDGRALRPGTMSDTTAPAVVPPDAGNRDDSRESIIVDDALAEAAPMQCDQLARTADDRVSAAVMSAKANSQCQVASDCQFAPRPSCSLFCAMDLLPHAGGAIVAAAIAAVNTEVCQQFKAMGCKPPSLPCLVTLGAVACVNGACTTTAPPSSRLPSAGGDDPDLPSSQL
jgi:hypothetical protein